jgi:23S rRNA-/tRNA-specific pseudouridylate synthase
VPLARYIGGTGSGAIFPALTSRTQANNAARRGELRLNGREANGASRVRSGDVLSLQTLPPPPLSPPSQRRLERFVDTLTLAAVRPEPDGGPEPGSGGLQVLHEDAEVAIIFKPPGVHSAPWAGTRKRWGTLTISDALPLLLSPPPAGRAAAAPLAAPLPAHRLDARVGGVLVCAKSRRALAGLSALFKERRVHKVYRAIVVGEVDLSLLAAHDSTPQSRLAKSRGAHRLDSASVAEGDGTDSVSVGELTCTAIEHAGDAGEVSPGVSVLRVEEAFEDGRESITEVRVLQITPCAVHGALTTLDLRPLTGRRHQLRVACALGLGAPILGDDLYHPRANTARAARNLPPLPPVRRRAGLFLQALEVTLPHPVTGDTLSVRACEMARFGKLRAKAASGAAFTNEEWEVWRA